MVLDCRVFFLIVVVGFLVHKWAGRLVFGLCFVFGLLFGVCLVVVVVVGAFFHVGCGWLWIGCGWQRASFKVDIPMRGGLLLEMARAPYQPSRKQLRQRSRRHHRGSQMDEKSQ